MSKRCLTCYYHKQRWEEAEAENKRLREALVELEAKMPEPKVWCCDFAKSSNGWNHNEKCPNWVLKF